MNELDRAKFLKLVLGVAMVPVIAKLPSPAKPPVLPEPIPEGAPVQLSTKVVAASGELLSLQVS
jgi:hypothetical protein